MPRKNARHYKIKRPEVSTRLGSRSHAFEFFEFRDVLWLVAGVLTFAFGLFVLVTGLSPRPIAALLATIALAAALLVALALIAPPDYADLVPEEARLDFGVDLPLDPEFSPFLALVAALGCIAGAAIAVVSRTAAES